MELDYVIMIRKFRKKRTFLVLNGSNQWHLLKSVVKNFRFAGQSWTSLLGRTSRVQRDLLPYNYALDCSVTRQSYTNVNSIMFTDIYFQESVDRTAALQCNLCLPTYT